MKKMKMIVMVCLLYSGWVSAQVRKGERVGDLRFGTVLNAPVKEIGMEQLQGKFLLLDFWATWCGSCIEAMPHLSALQKKYGNDLQVILVTSETAKRAGQFLNNRPGNLWIAIDTANLWGEKFPHRLIPHTVLISREGTLLANTDRK